MPSSFWVYSAIALVIGLVALVLARQLPETRLPKHSFWRELLRDVGIACLVAIIVSLIYEKSTRSISEHETAIDTLNKAMSSFVPGDVWTEVTKQVMGKNFLRRNVEIKIKLIRDGELLGGQKIAMPKGKAVLWMSYGYDLYGLTAGSSQVPVQHELDYQMWDKELRLPRFIRVTVSSPDPKGSQNYEGDSLSRIDNKKGSIILDKEDIINLPSPEKKTPTRITTERYEIVNVPGAYNLVMPELVAKSLDVNAPTMTISIESPADIEPEVATYYSAHQFKRPDPNKYFWTYDNIMLPGHGLFVLLKSPPDTQTSGVTQ